MAEEQYEKNREVYEEKMYELAKKLYDITALKGKSSNSLIEFDNAIDHLEEMAENPTQEKY